MQCIRLTGKSSFGLCIVRSPIKGPGFNPEVRFPAGYMDCELTGADKPRDNLPGKL